MCVSTLFRHFDIFGVGEFDSTIASTGEFVTYLMFLPRGQNVVTKIKSDFLYVTAEGTLYCLIHFQKKEERKKTCLSA